MTELPKNMTGLPKNIDDLLSRLADNSRSELDLVRQLADAIRRVDDQLLKEVRTVTLLHEMRREAIFTELQTLASRLCVIPARESLREAVPAIDSYPLQGSPSITEAVAATTTAGDWRQAAQRIDEELDDFFNGSGPPH